MGSIEIVPMDEVLFGDLFVVLLSDVWVVKMHSVYNVIGMI